MLDDIDKALNDFEQAVAGFRCIECEIPDHINEEINKLVQELQDYIKTFSNLIDEVEDRLNQAAALYKRKDVYDNPSTWSHAQNNQVPNIERSLRQSADAKKG